MVQVWLEGLLRACGPRVEFKELVLPVGAMPWSRVREAGFRRSLVSRVVEETGACYLVSLRIESLSRRRLSKAEMRNGAVTEKVARALVAVPVSRG